MREHDSEMKAMVGRANQLSQMICTWKSRVMYWAILLSKYSHLALEEPTAVKKPTNICKGEAISTPTTSNLPCNSTAVSKCGDFCIRDLKEEEWTWLSGEALEKVERLDPFLSTA